MNNSNGNQVAVLIDFENVCKGFRKRIVPPEPLNWENVLEAARMYGGSLICKAYADWSGNWNIQDRFSKIGIQPVAVLMLVRPMTAKTTSLQDGADILREVRRRKTRDGREGRCADGQAELLQARISLITWPCTSVNRRSMPLWRKVSFSWSMPSR